MEPSIRNIAAIFIEQAQYKLYMMEKANTDICYEAPRCGRNKANISLVLVATSWGLSVVASVCCAVLPSNNPQFTPVWDQNYLKPTAFTMDGVVGTLFWANLFVRQLICVGYTLRSQNNKFVDAINGTRWYLIAFNILHMGSTILYVLHKGSWAQAILVLNFAIMSALYFRHNGYPVFLHSAMVAGPLSWTFFALYWNGFYIAPQSDTARIIGAIFVWGILGYGLFFAYAYEDDSMCLFLSFLATSVGVYHVRARSELQQYISPIIIAVTLFVAAMLISLSQLLKERPHKRLLKSDKKRGDEEDVSQEIQKASEYHIEVTSR